LIWIGAGLLPDSVAGRLLALPGTAAFDAAPALVAPDLAALSASRVAAGPASSSFSWVTSMMYSKPASPSSVTTTINLRMSLSRPIKKRRTNPAFFAHALILPLRFLFSVDRQPPPWFAASASQAAADDHAS